MSQHDTLTQALQQIADWNSHTTEYAVDYGSNGVRDFYRNIARAALSATQPAQAAQSGNRPTPEWYARKIQETLDDDFAIGPAAVDEAHAAQPDGRGTDAQIEKERDIARHAIVGSLAAGYAGQSHPGADHWLAAAHEEGARIKDLEAQAAQGEPVRHIGDSKFESWYQAHPKANGGDKQLARDAYAAGMFDPVAQGAGEVVAWCTPDGERCVTARTYEGARKDGGAMWSSMAPFTVPAFTQPESGRKGTQMSPTTEKLWCIHIPGPDDLYAAPSHAVAERMAECHNKTMQEFFDKNPEKLPQWGLTVDECKAQVIEWPYGADEHAEDLADFDAEEWSSAQLQLAELHEPDAASLRQDERRAEWHEEMRRDAFGA